MIRLEDWEGNFFTVAADDFTVGDNTTNYKIDFTDVHADDGKNSSLIHHRGKMSTIINPIMHLDTIKLYFVWQASKSLECTYQKISVSD